MTKRALLAALAEHPDDAEVQIGVEQEPGSEEFATGEIAGVFVNEAEGDPLCPPGTLILAARAAAPDPYEELGGRAEAQAMATAIGNMLCGIDAKAEVQPDANGVALMTAVVRRAF